ncbi:2-phospho-L-lactate transferase [Actinospongicola halichondriae]|uniref:2-phospho-L-lactate transferase n=1 Tax=Actinospongicola halichondriae TaxID=3236844 RepID=UPI003D4C32C5
MSVAVLCGGVGAARLLSGLVHVVDPGDITALVNVGDDTVLHGLHISPDIDTIIYTLAGAIDPERGWGLVDETWNAMAQFGRLGNPTWFNLGDRDLATHIVRSERLARGDALSEITDHLARSWELRCGILPITDDRLRTMVTVADGEISFQEYFVGRQHDVAVSQVRFDGAEETVPAPGVLDALREAQHVVIAPSNPIVSIDPLLAVPGVRQAVENRRGDTVAVSPIVGGLAIKGPAANMLDELGHEASVVGIARLYAPLAATLVIDEADADRAGDVEAEGMRCVVTDTIMRDVDRATALARTVLA